MTDGADETGVATSTESTSGTEGTSGTSGTEGSTDTEGAEVTFRGLGDLPGGEFFSEAADVSADGMVVAGYSVSGESSPGVEVATRSVRWTDAAPQPIGELDGALFSEAQAVSADGQVVVGYAQMSRGTVAYRWTADDGPSELGGLPEGAADSKAYGVSADGSVIVGECVIAGVTEAFRWENGAATSLGHLSVGRGFEQSTAFGVSADGLVVVGSSGGEAFRWEGGEMIGLGHLPCAAPMSQAMAVSEDGSVVVGTSCHGDGFNEFEAFRWEDGEMAGLGDLEGAGVGSQALDVSGDGSVVVGSGWTDDGFRAFVWTQPMGMSDLAGLLGGSVDLDGWTLVVGRGISSDGSVIVGSNNGYAGQGNPNGQTEGWQISGLHWD